jgi:hypothetical protein
MSYLEKVDEDYVVRWAEERHFICLKVKVGVKGYPDRLFLSPYGHTIFIEFKRRGLKANFAQKERLQAYRIKELQRRGIPAFVVDTRLEALNILKAALEPTPLPDGSAEVDDEPSRSGPIPGPRTGENVVLLGGNKNPTREEINKARARNLEVSPHIRSMAERDKEMGGVPPPDLPDPPRAA